MPILGTEKITRFYGCQLTTTNSAKQHKLQKIIAYLSNKQGRGKEFISLYLPPKASTEQIAATIKKDAECIPTKNQNEADRLQDTLKNTLKHIKQQKETPSNGLAVFAGNYQNESETEALHIEELAPPQPLTSHQVFFDDHFHLDPLRDMLRDQRVIGLIALDAKDASLALATSENLQPLESLSSGIPGKTGKGGQSQRRYERERDMEVTAFFHRVAEHAAKSFLEDKKATVIIIGGPGQTKEDFLKGDFLNYELKNAVLKVIDTQSACEVGLREMFEKSQDALMTMCGPQEKKTMERLLTSLYKQDGMAIYGLDPVLEGLKRGIVEVALLTDNSDYVEVNLVCRNCGLPKTQIVNKKDVNALQQMKATACERCHAVEFDVVERDMVEVFEDAAAETNARVEVIFTDSEEKAKLKALGGFAALLRYKTA